MNRYQRLERVLRGVAGISGPDLQALAQLPAAQVDRLVAVILAARSAGRNDEKRARVRNRQGRARDVDDIAAGTSRLVRNGLARRAGEDLDALTALRDHFRDGDHLIADAVFTLRENGISDTDIGAALGCPAPYQRQDIYRRFGSHASQRQARQGVPEGG